MKSVRDYAKEWFDTLVVAISVAMAFRAYFYEPFKIPTGSMQPTLWGNHSVQGVEMGTWDSKPLALFKWLWSGSNVVELKAPVSGNVRVWRNANGTPVSPDGQIRIQVGTSPKVWTLPSDALATLPENRFVRAGETFWKGETRTGDFIFVNRWKWNLWQPQLGDVMIFSTTGINDLQQGTHYIKRMMGRPNETLEIRDGKLFVNGVETPYEKPVGIHGEAPKMLAAANPMDVKYGDADWIRGIYRLSDNQYFAAGDNSYPLDKSSDSRYWGPVPRENLRGVGSFVFWPFNRWRIIK